MEARRALCLHFSALTESECLAPVEKPTDNFTATPKRSHFLDHLLRRRWSVLPQNFTFSLCPHFYLFSKFCFGWHSSAASRCTMGSCLWDSWAYFHLPNTKNSSRTTLLFSHHSYSSQGLLTSLLISLNVLWFGQYVFTVWAKKCWGHHTPWGRSCETQLGQKLWIILGELCLIPDKSACQCGSLRFTTLLLLLPQKSKYIFKQEDRRIKLMSLQPNIQLQYLDTASLIFFLLSNKELNKLWKRQCYESGSLFFCHPGLNRTVKAKYWLALKKEIIFA